MITKSTLFFGPIARCWWIGGCLLAVVLAPGVSRADRVTKLVQILERGSDYKVRLQVAIALGKLASRRSVPALARTLGDDEPRVREMAARALGAIGDATALQALRRAGSTEQDSHAAAAIRRAVQTLEKKKRGPPAGTKLFVAVGAVSDRTGKAGRELPLLLREYLVSELTRLPGVATDWGGRVPTAAELSRRAINGLALDAVVTVLQVKPNGRQTEVSCRGEFTLATVHGKKTLGRFELGTSLLVPTERFDARYRQTTFADAVEVLAQVVRRHLANSGLSPRSVRHKPLKTKR